MRKQAIKTANFSGKRRFGSAWLIRKFCVSAELDLNLILLEKDALAICAVSSSPVT